MELNHNVGFPSLRSFRGRMGFGLQLRFDDEDLKPLIPLGAVAL